MPSNFMETKETPEHKPSTKKEKLKPQPPEKPKLIVFDGKVMEHAVRGGFDCYWPNHEIPEGEPTLRWMGQKIPLDSVWYPLMAFFEAQLEKTGGESTARLFYNPDDPFEQQHWKVWVFPQEGSSGMSAKEISDHIQRKIQSEALGASHICYGSVHHHCKMSAFQSGTDQDDEESQNGIHITVGHIGGDKYDLDMRCYVGRIKYKLNPDHYSNWFNLTPEWLSQVPERINYEWLRNIPQPMRALVASRLTMRVRSSIEGQLLVTPPPKNTEFPDVWMENMVKTESRVYSGHGMYGGTHQSPELYRQTGDLKDCPFGVAIWNFKLGRWEKKDWNQQTKEYGMVECTPPEVGKHDIKFPPGDHSKNVGEGQAPPRSSYTTTKDETDFLEEISMMAWEYDLTAMRIKTMFFGIEAEDIKQWTEKEREFTQDFIKIANFKRVNMAHARWLIQNVFKQDDIDIWKQMGAIKETDTMPNGAPPHGEKYDAATNTWGYPHEMMD